MLIINVRTFPYKITFNLTSVTGINSYISTTISELNEHQIVTPEDLLNSSLNTSQWITDKWSTHKTEELNESQSSILSYSIISDESLDNTTETIKQENIRNQLSEVRKVMHEKYITSIANIDDVNIPAQIIKNQNGIWPSKITLIGNSIISGIIENKMNITKG